MTIEGVGGFVFKRYSNLVALAFQKEGILIDGFIKATNFYCFFFLIIELSNLKLKVICYVFLYSEALNMILSSESPDSEDLND